MRGRIKLMDKRELIKHLSRLEKRSMRKDYTGDAVKYAFYRLMAKRYIK